MAQLVSALDILDSRSRVQSSYSAVGIFLDSASFQGEVGLGLGHLEPKNKTDALASSKEKDIVGAHLRLFLDFISALPVIIPSTLLNSIVISSLQYLIIPSRFFTPFLCLNGTLKSRLLL